VLRQIFSISMTREEFDALPDDIVRQVHGDRSYEGFTQLGQAIAGAITDQLGQVARSLGRRSGIEENSRVLDFGSGVGRVLSHLMTSAPHAQFTAFDIDPAMVQVLHNLKFDRPINIVRTTLELPDNSFDAIVAISVFTHLDDTAEFWLAEISRLLAPGGLAYITYQDESFFREHQSINVIPPQAVLHNKYVLGDGALEGSAPMGTYYTIGHFRSFLERTVEVLSLTPRGLLNHQSVAIVSKGSSKLNALTPTRDYAKRIEHDLFNVRSEMRRHRTDTEAHIQRLEAALAQQVNLNEQQSAEIGSLRAEMRRFTKDAEAFTRLLWECSDLKSGKIPSQERPRRFFRQLLRPPTRAEATPAASPVETRIAYYFHDCPFRIYSSSTCTLRGWCMSLTDAPVDEVRILIDERVFPAKFGLPEKSLLLPDGSIRTGASAGFTVDLSVKDPGRRRFAFQARRRGEAEWYDVLTMPVWAVEH